MIKPSLISLSSNEDSQEFHYHSFALNDVSNKVCIPNKTEDLNLSMFNMITGINGSKILRKYISCECKCVFDEKNYIIQINGGITINVGVSVKSSCM